MDRSEGTALAKSLAIGVVGGVVFQLIGMPLAWMLGPLTANLVVSARGVDVRIPEPLREVFLGVLGLVLGSQVTPQLAERVLDWPLSAALLLLGVAASTAAAAAWYRRCGFDSVSAWFASAPGAMTAMILMGETCGGDPRRIAISQSLRVVLVVLILPPLFWLYEGASGAEVAAATDRELSSPWLLLALPLLFPVGRRLRLPTPTLLTPLLFAGVLSGLDIASLSLPDVSMNLMLWVLGCAIGSRFRGLSSARLGRYLFEAFVATLVALAVLAGFAELIHRWVDVPRDVALLALAPGGIGEMAILAVALDLDPVFVAFHHLLRMVALMLFAPFWARWLSRRSDQ
ncbi:AbrB family transcriptional regulator [Billgrantia antri]|uniref:AbrB family transcriptional regulator n=1 Tax=Billgrantia antri TaxID=2846777 RepID=UPI003B217354